MIMEQIIKINKCDDDSISMGRAHLDDSFYNQEGARIRRNIFNDTYDFDKNTYLNKNEQKDDETIEFEDTQTEIVKHHHPHAQITSTYQQLQLITDQSQIDCIHKNTDSLQLKEGQYTIDIEDLSAVSSIIQSNQTKQSKYIPTQNICDQENAYANHQQYSDNPHSNKDIYNDISKSSINNMNENIQNRDQRKSRKQLISHSDKEKQSSRSNMSKSNMKNSELLINIKGGGGGDVYWKFLGVMKKVKKYVHILSSMNYYRSYTNMQRINFNAINDLSYYLQTDIDFSFQNILKKFQVIEPNSTKALVWNIVLLIVLFLENVFIPLKISLNIIIVPDSPLYYVSFMLPCAVLFFDVLINFNISYYEKGILVSDNLRIIQNYIKFDFFLNLLTTSAFLLSQQIYLIEALLMIRLIQIPSLISKIDEHFQIQQRFNTVFELGKLLVLVFYCAHLVGCGFHYVAQLEIKNGIEITWLHKQEINDSGIEIRYLFSIYFAFITMVTVGYGDITPYTPIEKIYTIIITIFSCGMFGYSMNTIGAIFQEISKKEADFKQVKYDMTQYMRSRGIPMYLQIKVLKNIEYTNALKGNQVKKGEQIMESLTQTLRNQIKREFYGNILTNYKLFNLNFSQEARNDICLQMKEIIVQPGEMIFEQGGLNDKIYFLYRGEVDIVIFNQNNSYVLAGKAQVGSMLGQKGFFTSFQENYGARSSDTSYLLYCDRNNFIQTLAKYKTDYEIFFKLRDNIMIFNREWDTMCFSCNKLGHQTNNCSFYNLNLLKLMIVSRYNRPIAQQRNQNTYKKNRIQFKSLQQRNFIMINARKIRLNYFFQAFEGNMVEFQDEELDLQQNDMEFMIFIPCIHYENQCLVYSEREISEFSDGEFEREQQEHNYYQQYKPKQSQQYVTEKQSFRGRLNIFDAGLKSKLQEIQSLYKQNQSIFKSKCDSSDDESNSSYSSDQQDNDKNEEEEEENDNNNYDDDDDDEENKQIKKKYVYSENNVENIQDYSEVYQKNNEVEEAEQENIQKNGSIWTPLQSREENTLSAIEITLPAKENASSIREYKVLDQQDKSTFKNYSRKIIHYRESSKDIKNRRSSFSSSFNTHHVLQTKDNIEMESEQQCKDAQALSLGFIKCSSQPSNPCYHQQQSESNISQSEDLNPSLVHTVSGFGQLHNINSTLTRVKQQKDHQKDSINSDFENIKNKYSFKNEKSIADYVSKDGMIKSKQSAFSSRDQLQSRLNLQKSYSLKQQSLQSPQQSFLKRGSLIKSNNMNDFTLNEHNQNMKEQQRKRSLQFAPFTNMNMPIHQYHQTHINQKSQKSLDKHIQPGNHQVSSYKQLSSYNQFSSNNQLSSNHQLSDTIHFNQMLSRDHKISSKQKPSLLFLETMKARSSQRTILLPKLDNMSMQTQSQLPNFQVYNHTNYGRENAFMLDHFDNSKEYLGYYPHNNISKVMKKCKSIYNKQVMIKIKIRNKKRKLSKRKFTEILQAPIIA